MKKFITLLSVIFALSTFAQAPQGFNYQATVRNSSGVLITNQNVLFKFNIMLDSQSSNPVYSETHFVTTDDLGHINSVVGTGTSLIGSFSTIDWGAGVYYLGIELNTGGGFVNMGTNQLFSVPYALFAQTSSTTLTSNQDIQGVLNTGNFALTDLVTSPNNHAILLNSKGGSDPNAFYRGFNSVLNNQTGQTLNGQNRAIQSSTFGPNEGTAYGVATFVADASLTFGVYGQALTTTNYDNQLQKIGVSGVSINMSNANSWGVAGTARDSEAFNIGVGGYCTNGNTTAGNNYGLYANVNSVTATGNNYGVYSNVSNGVNNYAGYFNGDVTITGTLVQPSDRKLKREIKPLVSALDKINQLSPVTYYYNSNSTINLPSRLQYGFIAQELEGVFPELVVNQTIDAPPADAPKEGKSGIKELDDNLNVSTPNSKKRTVVTNQKEEFKGINYTGLISILTEGIKEQQAQIKELKVKNEALEKRLSAIEKLLKK
jgi:hypothetical protein